MSTASISYSSLGDASSEAKAVARKLDKYADSLYDNVYKKLNNYGGSYNSNISSAKTQTNSKIQNLRTEQSQYETYATSLTNLRDECKRVDKAVRTNVSALTATFKEANGIRNSKIENAISYFCTSVNNKTAFGRTASGIYDDVKAGVNYLKDSIKEWYNYEGGKELLKAALIIALDIVIAVAGVVIAIVTFLAGALTIGAVIVLAAALVAGAIALQDAWADYENEKAAYAARQNNDPATGKRRSDINSFSDYLRSSYMYGDSGEYYQYDSFFNRLALGLDIASLACTVVTVISSCGKLLTNGFKWATNDSSATFKQLITKGGLSKMFKGIGNNFKNGLSKLGNAIKMKDITFFKKESLKFLGDSLNLFKNRYANFDTGKDALSSLKNGYSLAKSVVKDGVTVGNVLEKIILPSVGLAHIPGGDKMITANDFYKIIDDVGSDIIGNDLWKSDNIINTDVLGQLSLPSEISISIPAI